MQRATPDAPLSESPQADGRTTTYRLITNLKIVLSTHTMSASDETSAADETSDDVDNNNSSEGASSNEWVVVVVVALVLCGFLLLGLGSWYTRAENDIIPDEVGVKGPNCPSWGQQPKPCKNRQDYFRQTKVFHPDKNRDCENVALEKFKRLQGIPSCKRLF